MSFAEFTLETLEQRMPPPAAQRIAGLPTGHTLDGLLHIVTPELLDEPLAQWLGGVDQSRTPFARTAFGDMIYVRDLRERARSLGLDAETARTAHDVSMVDVRYKRTKLLGTSVGSFLAKLAVPEWVASELDKGLYDAAVDRLGPPAFEEIYAFVPALALGGAENPDNLQRQRADVALNILFQL